tara:strand:- start:8354 stop:9223 length:870 start_codon:yes stop_codon:yes gene_type:complete
MGENEQLVLDEVFGGEAPAPEEKPEQVPLDETQIKEQGEEIAGEKVKETQKPSVPEETKKKSKPSRRVVKLLDRLNEEKQKNAKLKQRLNEAQEVDLGKKPHEDDFEVYDDYQAALDTYEDKLLDVKVDKKIKDQQTKEADSRVYQVHTEVLEAFNSHVDELAKDRPGDFKETINSKVVPFNDFSKEYIFSSENGADIAYFIAKNPGYAQQLSQMANVQSSRELVALENRIVAESKTKKISTAPDPITPVGASGAGVNKKLSDLDNASADDWLAKRNADLKAKGKPLSY